ncbi:hypothetical protein HYPBUDRAFT_151103 [Hyphopichia burtonii NRRL Y-1933]|uniref:Uncharacterized protein n=1 Tax=Hyphopichia burtonii NRRL Y-1933 TaxID=984485 RepID=A0A1E4RPP4_9ASCO|nr:hypothetical protein HYPBUDRAFT_151103 [Hyphopichia burtonii NRRL Y-1933]ODV69243.1 hypothetical protein HYPBUDRAFT_151103 [Hyphopichia burtonii NRRL Y-1933]
MANFNFNPSTTNINLRLGFFNKILLRAVYRICENLFLKGNYQTLASAMNILLLVVLFTQINLTSFFRVNNLFQICIFLSFCIFKTR